MKSESRDHSHGTPVDRHKQERVRLALCAAGQEERRDEDEQRAQNHLRHPTHEGRMHMGMAYPMGERRAANQADQDGEPDEQRQHQPENPVRRNVSGRQEVVTSSVPMFRK